MKCRLCGGQLFECERCHKPTPRAFPRQKYCEQCAAMTIIERNKEYCKEKYQRRKMRAAGAKT